jgi:hypothetical protein
MILAFDQHALVLSVATSIRVVLEFSNLDFKIIAYLLILSQNLSMVLMLQNSIWLISLR